MRPQRMPSRPERLLATLMLLLTGCASELPSWSPPVTAPAIPPLPQLARQPPIPSACLPTCSAALTVERESWLSTPIPPALPDRRAKEHTTP